MARVVVVDDRPTVEPSAVMPAMPTPTPTSAVSSDMPAAIIEPKVRTRTTAETAIPMASEEPPMDCSTLTASPPASALSPLLRAFSSTSSRASCALSFTLVWTTL